LWKAQRTVLGSAGRPQGRGQYERWKKGGKEKERTNTEGHLGLHNLRTSKQRGDLVLLLLLESLLRLKTLLLLLLVLDLLVDSLGGLLRLDGLDLLLDLGRLVLVLQAEGLHVESSRVRSRDKREVARGEEKRERSAVKVGEGEERCYRSVETQ
jgi:hypothetical protein